MKTILILVVIQLGIFAWLQYKNNCPVAIADEVSVFEGHSVKIQPLHNDIDEDKDEIAINGVIKPLYGEITQKDKVLIYYVKKGFVGVDSFTYTISDGDKVSDEAFIKVKVKENLRPVALNRNVQFYRAKDVNIDVLESVRDMEGDSVFVKEFSKPEHGQLTKKGNKLIYTVTDNSIQKDSFYYTLSDGFSLSERATVYINIKEKNYIS